jgi:hypothetical protein
MLSFSTRPRACEYTALKAGFAPEPVRLSSCQYDIMVALRIAKPNSQGALSLVARSLRLVMSNIGE